MRIAATLINVLKMKNYIVYLDVDVQEAENYVKIKYKNICSLSLDIIRKLVEKKLWRIVDHICWSADQASKDTWDGGFFSEGLKGELHINGKFSDVIRVYAALKNNKFKNVRFEEYQDA